MANSTITDAIKRLKNLADLGLFYSTNEYDKDRYLEIQSISFQLLHQVSGRSIDELKNAFSLVKEYPTAKVDIRGLVMADDKKILLVQESSDGRWSLPGGWADIGYSPKEVITKEFKEETGLDVLPERLLAVFDKKMHPHPAELFYIYKMVFLCSATSSILKKGFDVLDVGYFSLDALPPLSEDRILKSQLELVCQKALAADTETYFD